MIYNYGFVIANDPFLWTAVSNIGPIMVYLKVTGKVYFSFPEYEPLSHTHTHTPTHPPSNFNKHPLS